MSYCRFSSDDWLSDVYAYDHVDGGITIHVAGIRYVFDRSQLPPRVDPVVDGFDGYFRRYQTVSALVRSAARERIGGPYDGHSWDGLSHEEALTVLNTLVEAGYHVPALAFEQLREELHDYSNPR